MAQKRKSTREVKLGETDLEENTKVTELKCGVVMPISAMPDYPAQHWLDVREILYSAIASTEFEANMVSAADEIGIIQGRIVKNLFSNEMVVCDVSGKNPNVMFELGLRLAFDKPVVIVKDDQTDYTFDTSVIEHITYPKSLRFQDVIDFQEELTARIIATHKRASTDDTFSPFVGHFGEFKPVVIETKEVPQLEYVAEQLKDIRGLLSARPSRAFVAALGRDDYIADRVHLTKPLSVKQFTALRAELLEFAEGDLLSVRRPHDKSEIVELRFRPNTSNTLREELGEVVGSFTGGDD